MRESLLVPEKKSDSKKGKVRVRVPRKAYLVRFFLHPAGKALVVSFTLAFVLVAGALTYYYAKYSSLIDQKLRAGPFANTSKIFAAPRLIAVGDPSTASEIAAELRRCGYTESRGNAIGWFQIRADGAIEIFPGPDSYFDAGGRPDQVRQRPNLADRLPARQYGARPIPARAAAHHQPLRPQPREAPPGEVRRYPESADRRRHLGRGQALLPAPGLRPAAHREGGLCGPERGAQGAGRVHAEPATGAETCGWIPRSAGRASWRKS